MPTSVRLDRATELMVDRLSKARSQTKSEVIRDAIHLLASEGAEANETAYDRLRPFIGRVDSGGQNLSERSGERFRAKLQERRRARNAR